MKTTIKTTVSKVYCTIEVEQKTAIVKALSKQAKLDAFIYYIKTALDTAIRNDAVISTVGCMEMLEKLLEIENLKGGIGDVWCKLEESNDFEEWWDSSKANGSSSYELENFAAKLKGNGIDDYKTHVNEAKATISEFNSEKEWLKQKYNVLLVNNLLMHSRCF